MLLAKDKWLEMFDDCTRIEKLVNKLDNDKTSLRIRAITAIIKSMKMRIESAINELEK